MVRYFPHGQILYVIILLLLYRSKTEKIGKTERKCIRWKLSSLQNFVIPWLNNCSGSNFFEKVLTFLMIYITQLIS